MRTKGYIWWEFKLVQLLSSWEAEAGGSEI
jgi:hypothetical protein